MNGNKDNLYNDEIDENNLLENINELKINENKNDLKYYLIQNIKDIDIDKINENIIKEIS